MKRVTVFVTAACAGVGSAAFGGGPQIPGTLNFENITGTHINQTVAESNSNEKEVDFGDFDNDGDLDVVIAVAFSDFGQRRNKLYRNDGGTFNEVSGSPIISGFSGTDVARNAFLRDYDGDGWLDIWIINDSNTPGSPGLDKLYLNIQSGGVFDHFQQTFIGVTGPACSGVSIDADLEGDFDVYVGNYPNNSQDTMFFNNGAGIFSNVTNTMVPSDGDYTVDVAAADMNGDGTLDLLISNWGNNELYYNNRLGLGSQDGDYRYAGSVQVLANASTQENAMEPGDFDGDGDMDFYWTNKVGSGDRIWSSTGVNGNDQVFFTEIGNLPASVATRVSTKPTAADLNGDGRLDLLVGGHTTRPTILRNTTVNGQVSFVDWTPGDAFPNGSVHRGWHAAVFDSDGDGDPDIFLGGWTNDHLFENVPPNQTTEGKAGGILPALYNASPVALVGSGGSGEEDEFTVLGIGNSSFISIVLNGADNYLLQLINSGGAVISTSDRGGLGIEEAMQVTTSAQTYTIRVTIQECAINVVGDCGFEIADLLAMLAAWGPNPGHPADFNGDDFVGISDLLEGLANWGPSDYVLEALSRSGP